MTSEKELPMLPLYETPAHDSYHDTESRTSHSSLHSDSRPTLKEETEGLPYERPGLWARIVDESRSLWRQVVEYAEHVSGPNTRGAVLCKVAVIALFVSSIFALIFVSVRGSPPSTPSFGSSTSQTLASTDKSMDAAIRALWKSTIPAYDADVETIDGSQFHINPPAQWIQPLGQQLCIVNTDTRPMNDTNQVWAANETTFDWREVSGWSGAGYLNQYLYSRIHGYRYIYVQTAAPPGYVGAWARPGAWRHILPQCRVIVYADSDVIYANLHLPFEWLLNHWGVPYHSSSINMALEPKEVPGWNLNDIHGKHSQNPGFTVIHNAPGEHKIQTMLSKWTNCLSETDYPGCASLKSDWPAEMGGFNNYIRYDFPELVRTIPCTEALGWPEWDMECKGLFLRHYTLRKDLVKPGMEEAIARPLMTALQKDMVRQKSKLFDDETGEMWVGLAKENDSAEEEGESGP